MTKQPFPASKPTTFCVCGSEISFSSSVRNLAFYITAHDTNVELHKNDACRLAYFELRCIGSVGHLLSVNSTKTLGSAFLPLGQTAVKRLDLPLSSLGETAAKRPFQAVLHTLLGSTKGSILSCGVVFKTRKWDHVLSLPSTLHWLPKLSTLCHSFSLCYSPCFSALSFSCVHSIKIVRSSSDSTNLLISHV